MKITNATCEWCKHFAKLTMEANLTYSIENVCIKRLLTHSWQGFKKAIIDRNDVCCDMFEPIDNEVIDFHLFEQAEKDKFPYYENIQEIANYIKRNKKQ